MNAQNRIVTSLAVTQVVGSLGIGAGLTIGTLMVKDITGSTGWAGTATVVAIIGAASVTVPLGTMAARYGRRPALLTGWTIALVGALISIQAAVIDSLPLVLVGLALFGASTSTNLQSRFAAVDQAEESSIARSISLVVWAGTIGAVIGPNLVDPGAVVARHLDIPPLAGPMVFAAAGFGLAALMTWATLRPEPLAASIGRVVGRPSIRSALPHVRGQVALAIYAVGTAHAIMVSVMALTPVHMQDHGSTLRIIGITISLHIAGMFALSPVMGWLSDRVGPRPTILAGQVVLIAATVISGTAGHSESQVMLGLTLLGIGWSASVIAGAALVSSSTEPAVRPLVQSLTDLTMQLSGAAGGLLAGLIVASFGFGLLNAAAAMLALPLIVAVLISLRPKVVEPAR